MFMLNAVLCRKFTGNVVGVTVQCYHNYDVRCLKTWSVRLHCVRRHTTHLPWSHFNLNVSLQRGF